MAALLVIEGLTKRFRGLVANSDVSFALAAGELRCIIGPNGAGKTTFISMISGHVIPTSGRILFKDRDITRLPVHVRARIGIGRKFQTPTVFDNLSVYENIELAVLATPTPRRGRHAKIMRTLDLVRLADHSGQTVGALAHGARQWLEVGILLAGEAQLLLLDEPTAGMTAEETHSTGELIRRLVRELSLSAIIIEHDINFIRDLKAPVTVLHLGRVLVEGSFAEIERNEQVRSVYLGNA